MLLIFFYFCVRYNINYYEIYWIFCWCYLFCPFFLHFPKFNNIIISFHFNIVHSLTNVPEGTKPTNAVKYEIIPLIYQEKSRSTSFLTIAWKKNFLKGCQTLPLTLLWYENRMSISHTNISYSARQKQEIQLHVFKLICLKFKKIIIIF